MTEFIYQIQKEEFEKYIKLKIFKVNDKFETKTEEIKQNYQILMKEKDFLKLNLKSDNIILSNKKFLNKNKEKVLKIEFKSKELFDYILSEIRDAQFELYEADFPEEHRYLVDNKVEILQNANKNKQFIPLKYLTIDIETIGDLKNPKIVSISTYSPQDFKINAVYINTKNINKDQKEKIKTQFTSNLGLPNIKIYQFESEKDMLEVFIKDILKFKPQMILGWNVIDFDFKILKKKIEDNGLEFKLSNYDGKCILRIQKDFFKDSTLICPGVLIFDMIQILKMNFIHFENYRLNTVASEVLGEEKIDVFEEVEVEENEDKVKAIENLYLNNTAKLLEYNFKDSYLTSQIFEKLNLMELMCKRSIIAKIPLSKVKSPIATLDRLYIEKLHERGFVAPSNFNFTTSNPISGAYVIEPEKGFYLDVFVFDFKSLYPSIIMTFNIDPFSYDEGEDIIAPNGARFTSKPSILSELILNLYQQRDIAKKQKDLVTSQVLKILMNSFYGALASPKSRFYNKDVSGAITSFGRHILTKAKDFVEAKKKEKVVYGDTDSIFVKIHGVEGKCLEDKKKDGFELEKALNKYFKVWVEENFKTKNYLIMEFEKLFSKFFIASKKRYVGFDEFTQKISFVGMEAIRGDWTPLAQEFQVKLIEMIFKDKSKDEIKKFILDYVEKLKKGEFDDKLIYTKKITKLLSEYTKTTPPHVKAAREIKNFKGREVKYVLLKEGPKHINKIQELSNLGLPINYDYEHYIEKQLKGVSDDILDAFGIDFDEVLNSKKQTKLDRFF